MLRQPHFAHARHIALRRRIAFLCKGTRAQIPRRAIKNIDVDIGGWGTIGAGCWSDEVEDTIRLIQASEIRDGRRRVLPTDFAITGLASDQRCALDIVIGIIRQDGGEFRRLGDGGLPVVG
jgi:hypothetical protein